MGGKRKYIITLCVLFVTGGLCAFSKVDGASFANVVITALLAFSGANGVEHVAKVWAAKK
jgi:hypothetical protein